MINWIINQTVNYPLLPVHRGLCRTGHKDNPGLEMFLMSAYTCKDMSKILVSTPIKTGRILPRQMIKKWAWTESHLCRLYLAQAPEFTPQWNKSELLLEHIQTNKKGKGHYNWH